MCVCPKNPLRHILRTKKIQILLFVFEEGDPPLKLSSYWLPNFNPILYDSNAKFLVHFKSLMPYENVRLVEPFQ